MANHGLVLRVFEVRTKPVCTDQLLQKFSTTSAALVWRHCKYLLLRLHAAQFVGAERLQSIGHAGRERR